MIIIFCILLYTVECGMFKHCAVQLWILSWWITLFQRMILKLFLAVLRWNGNELDRILCVATGHLDSSTFTVVTKNTIGVWCISTVFTTEWSQLCDCYFFKFLVSMLSWAVVNIRSQRNAATVHNIEHHQL